MTSTSFQSIKFKDPKAKSLIEERITTPEGDVHVKIYQKEKLLGKGNTGLVYQIVEKECQRLLAAKIVSKAFLKKGQNQQKLLSEIQIHKTLQHPNIVQFEHVFEDKESIYILMELCQNNTLKSLVNGNKRLTEVEVQYYMYQIIDGLRYIHSKGIIHRDLKLRNILLTEDMKVKIGDFGLAVKADPSGEKLKVACGTPNFVAPEVLNQTGYSYEVDIWALGVICYTLLTGKMPFDTVDNKDTYKKIQNADYSFPQDMDISEPAKDFISKILVLDPSQRPTLDDMYNHPFLSTKGIVLKAMPVPIQNTGSTTAFLETLAKNRLPPIDTGKENIPSEVSTGKQMRKSKSMVGPLKLTVFKRRLPSLSSNTDLKSAVKSADDHLMNRKETPSTQASISSLPVITEGATSAKRLKFDPKGQNNKEEIVSIMSFLEYPKHGIGYYLSNSSIGVLFHDSTKMVLSPPYTNFEYILNTFVEKKEVRTNHGLLDFPKELNKKVSVLQRFRDYFNQNKDSTDLDILLPGCETKKKAEAILPRKKNAANLVFMRKWIKTKQAMIFRLNTQTWQANFKDKTELIINPKKQLVMFRDTEGEKHTWVLEDVPNCGNEEVIMRVTYAQEVIKKARQMEKEAN